VGVPDRRSALCSKLGEAREWPVSLVFARQFLRSAMPSHIDNQTLTLHSISNCCSASEVGCEPILLKEPVFLQSFGIFERKSDAREFYSGVGRFGVLPAFHTLAAVMMTLI
tara:strand:- start:5837 stop:6169 length:333 start_codon:yes stop_codon:yes gene_type:complete